MSVKYRAKIIRNNLTTVARLAVKSIIDRSCFDHLDDKSVEVNNFCNILENIFYFALKGSNTHTLFSEPVKHPWQAVLKCCRHIPHNCFTTLSAMTHLKSDYAKLRAWIRMALLEKRLHEYLAELVKHHDVLLGYYTEEGVFLSPDVALLLNTVVGLSALDFDFDLRTNSLNYVGFIPADYTPYLKFFQSPESVLDDLYECEGRHDQEADCPWRKKFQKLETKCKTAMDQKSYLEETLQRLNRTVSHLQTERKHAITFMKQLEVVIHDLQNHLTSLQEQYKRDMLQRCGVVVRVAPVLSKPQLPSVEEMFPSSSSASHEVRPSEDVEALLLGELQGEEEELLMRDQWDDSAFLGPLHMVTPAAPRPQQQTHRPPLPHHQHQHPGTFEIGHQRYTPHSVHYRSPTPPGCIQRQRISLHSCRPHHHTTGPIPRDTCNNHLLTSSLPTVSATRDHEVQGCCTPLGAHLQANSGLASHQTPEIVRRLRSGEMEDSSYYHLVAQDEEDEDERSPARQLPQGQSSVTISNVLSECGHSQQVEVDETEKAVHVVPMLAHSERVQS